MAARNWFSVIVRGADDGEHKVLSETIDGHTLSVTPDGMLSIFGDRQRSLMMSAGNYDGFELQRIKNPDAAG